MTSAPTLPAATWISGSSPKLPGGGGGGEGGGRGLCSLFGTGFRKILLEPYLGPGRFDAINRTRPFDAAFGKNSLGRLQESEP